MAVLLLLAGCTRVLDVSGSEWRLANASIRRITYDQVECARESEHKGDLPDAIAGGIVDMIVRPLEDVRPTPSLVAVSVTPKIAFANDFVVGEACS